MFKLLVIAFVMLQCLVIGSWGKPTESKTIVDIGGQSFNTTQLVETVKKLSKEPAKFRRIVTISLLLGAIRSEEQMEKELIKMTNELLDTFHTSTMAEKEKKLKEISKFVQRDLRAMFLVSSAIDLTQYNASVTEFRNSMREFVLQGEQLVPRLDRFVLTNGKSPEETIRNFINDHITILRNTLTNRVTTSVASLKEDDQKRKKQRSTTMQPIVVNSSESPEMNAISKKGKDSTTKATPKEKGNAKKRSGMADAGDALQNIELIPVYFVPLVPFQNEIMSHYREITRVRREPSEEGEEEERKSERQEEEEEEFEPIDEGPGGLVGLIANLSGGGEGSDVGAVLGAITGVVARLLGPGGLDIEGLLSTGTGLLSGLLAGDENFGTVLSRYIGVSLDGFSGGGGADNNGQFVGYLLGGVVAALSADPEDEDVNPIKPGIFVKNLLMASFQGSSPKGDGEDAGEDRKDDHDELKEASERKEIRARQSAQMMMPGSGIDANGGSDIFGFIFGIIKGVVGGVKSIIVNTLAGLSSGASKGSMDLASKVAGPLSSGSDGLAAALTT